MRVLSRPLSTALARRCGTISSVQTDDSAIALTFDDGPHPDVTPKLLHLLEKHGARGTFFCMGRNAKCNPQIIRRAAEAGHCIANHTYDHISFPLMDAEGRRAQIGMCSKVLQPYEQRFFRPPYGHQSVLSHFDARRLGYEVVGWNVSGGDWLDASPEWMAQRLISRINSGSIVLLHDRISCAPKAACFGREPMLTALRIVLEHWSGRFRCVTVPELLSLGAPRRVNWYWEADVSWLQSLRDEDGLQWDYVLPPRGKHSSGDHKKDRS